MPSYPSPYIFLNSGKRFYYAHPEHNRSGFNAIDINDIAAGLRQPRYTGQTVELYTIAQHAVFVAEILESWNCDPYTVYMGLHHDDHEAFCGDFPTPLQDWLKDAHDGLDVLRWAKNELDKQIMPAVGIAWPPQEGLWQVVKEADYSAFLCEAKQLFREAPLFTAPFSGRMVDKSLTVMSSFKAVDLYLGTHARLATACGIKLSREA